MTLPLAYSYIRMSTNLQLKGDSLRRQTELSRAYAEKHGLRLVSDTELQDIGISAFKGDNVASGALGKFLAGAKAGQVPAGSYLLVESLDRLTRQELLPSIQLLLDIVGLSINVVTLIDGKEYSKSNTDMTSMMYSIMLMSRAHEESQTKSRRVYAAWDAKRGRIANQKLTRICPAWLILADDKRAFHVIEGHRETVQRIFDLADQGMGAYSITKWLNQHSIPSFGRTVLWGQSYVTKILQNRAVLGEYQPHVLVDGRRKPEGDPIPDYFPSVIDEALFYRVQQARRSRAVGTGGRRGETQRNLFTHIAKCGYCGSAMRLVNKGTGPKGGVYLKCDRARAGGECSNTSWRYDEFEQSFLFFVREIDLDGALNAATKQDVKREHENRRKGLEAKLQHEKLRRDRLLDLLTDERQDMSVLSERLASAEQQIRQIADEISALGLPDEHGQSRAFTSKSLLELIDSVRGQDTLEQRVKLASYLKSVVSHISLMAEGELPRIAKMEKVYADIDDKEFLTRYHNYLSDKDSKLDPSMPTFIVVLRDGRFRNVKVPRGNPTKFVDMLAGSGIGTGNVDIGEFGKALTWDGTDQVGWFLPDESKKIDAC